MVRDLGFVRDKGDDGAADDGGADDDGGGYITHEAAQQLFVEVNFEVDRNSMLGQANDDRALMRWELLEVTSPLLLLPSRLLSLLRRALLRISGSGERARWRGERARGAASRGRPHRVAGVGSVVSRRPV